MLLGSSLTHSGLCGMSLLVGCLLSLGEGIGQSWGLAGMAWTWEMVYGGRIQVEIQFH